jgi:hypothetical protein
MPEKIRRLRALATAHLLRVPDGLPLLLHCKSTQVADYAAHYPAKGCGVLLPTRTTHSAGACAHDEVERLRHLRENAQEVVKLWAPSSGWKGPEGLSIPAKVKVAQETLKEWESKVAQRVADDGKQLMRDGYGPGCKVGDSVRIFRGKHAGRTAKIRDTSETGASYYVEDSKTGDRMLVRATSCVADQHG